MSCLEVEQECIFKCDLDIFDIGYIEREMEGFRDLIVTKYKSS